MEAVSDIFGQVNVSLRDVLSASWITPQKISLVINEAKILAVRMIQLIMRQALSVV